MQQGIGSGGGGETKTPVSRCQGRFYSPEGEGKLKEIPHVPIHAKSLMAKREHLLGGELKGRV